MAQKKKATTQPPLTAKEKTDLTDAEKVETFVGKQKYYVVTGTDKHGKDMYVWVPADKKQKFSQKSQ